MSSWKLFQDGRIGGRYASTLDSLIKEIDRTKGDLVLENVFRTIADALSPLGVSLVFAMYNKPRQELVVRFAVLIPEHTANGDVAPSLIDRTIPVRGIGWFETALKNGQAASPPWKDCLLARLLSHADLVEPLKRAACSSIPLSFHGETIALVEFLGDAFSETDQRAFRAFAATLMRNIAYIILFQEARRSEHRYRRLFDNANEAVYAIEANGDIKLANPAFYGITGYAPADLPINYLAIVHPNDKTKIAARFRDRMAGKTLTSTSEFKLLRKDGDTRHVSFSAALIEDGGEKRGIQIIARDITDTQRLQEKIRLSKLHYEQIIDTITDAICVISRDYKITGCNRSFAEKTGRPIEAIVGRPCGEVIPHYEDDILSQHCVRTVCNATCGTEKVFKTGEKLFYTETNTDRAGRPHYHNITIYPAKNNSGEITEVVLTIRDVTERMEAQEQVRQLSEFNRRIVEYAPVSIVVLGKDGRIIAANDLAKRLIEHDGRSAVGFRLVESEEIANDPALVTSYTTLLSEGRSFTHDKLPYRVSKTDEGRFLNIIAVPLYGDDQRTVEGAISMALDTTDSVKAKLALEQMNRTLESKVNERTKELNVINKRLSQAIGLKSKFIADASHELRTPLTVIQGNFDLAVREATAAGKPVPEAFDLILSEVERMTRILSELTLLTNADSMSEQLTFETVDLFELAQSVHQSLSVLAGQKSIALTVTPCPKPAVIKGDEAKLEKLLLNIVRNAIKYTEKGRVEIAVIAETDHIRLVVTDTGIGIPSDDLPFIFERFYRVDKARSREEGGTGLGLSIVKWIADQHEAAIDVKSTVGKGTVFTISFPSDRRRNN